MLPRSTVVALLLAGCGGSSASISVTTSRCAISSARRVEITATFDVALDQGQFFDVRGTPDSTATMQWNATHDYRCGTWNTVTANTDKAGCERTADPGRQSIMVLVVNTLDIGTVSGAVAMPLEASTHANTTSTEPLFMTADTIDCM